MPRSLTSLTQIARPFSAFTKLSMVFDKWAVLGIILSRLCLRNMVYAAVKSTMVSSTEFGPPLRTCPYPCRQMDLPFVCCYLFMWMMALLRPILLSSMRTLLSTSIVTSPSVIWVPSVAFLVSMLSTIENEGSCIYLRNSSLMSFSLRMASPRHDCKTFRCVPSCTQHGASWVF